MTNKIAKNILELVGDTPMVELTKVVPEGSARILAKLESFNPGGSVKDRIALSMINEAERKGLIKEGTVIIEPTSGNTGIGLAMVCAAKGYKLVLAMPDTMSVERQSLLRSYGAELVLTCGAEGMAGACKMAEELLKQEKDGFIPQQFKNPANPGIHKCTTAEEIWCDTGGKFDAFVAGIGTGGTITGCGEFFKEKNPKIKIVGIEPKESPVLSGGQPGSHKIQGIGAGFVPDVLNRKVIDEVQQVGGNESWKMSRRLAEEEGIFVGISSGAAALVASCVAKGLGEGKTVVAIFPDTGERYLSLFESFEG